MVMLSFAADHDGCAFMGFMKQLQCAPWDFVDNFALGVELNLGNYSNNRDYGRYAFDTLELGYPGSGGASVNHSVIAAIETKDFYLGYIGLSPYPINFTTVDIPPPSLLSQLKTEEQIPSLSYGYSAGAQYRLKQTLGTLTLGGYDESRFTPNDVSFTFAEDISRDLVLVIQSIEYSDAENSTKQLLLSESVLTFIDSTVPHIWLPREACDAFESAFGLTYDNATHLYFIDADSHDLLEERNPSVSFILAEGMEGGETVNITFPYASFDLTVSSPIVARPTRYFPIRRADNATQHTLGRAFLQEAYLTVDYERKNFSVSQAAFVEGATSKLMPILSPDAVSANATSSGQGSSALPTPVMAGIIVGIVAFCLLVIGATVTFFWKRRRARMRLAAQQAQETSKEEQYQKPELDSTSTIPPGELNAEFGDGKYRPPEVEGSPGPRGDVAEAEGQHGGTEMEGTKGGVEMAGSGGVAEMDGSKGRAEMNGSGGVAEMQGNNGAVQELEAAHVYELPAGGVTAKVPRSDSALERIRISRLAGFRKKQETNGGVERGD
ncbi:MAG: hypothetical protein Q9174_002913 [Haloplaca sp. 1 TL-2023]